MSGEKEFERLRFQLRMEGIPDETRNPLRCGVHTRGYLPHVKREGASYSVTFRLADSLPRQVLLDYQAERSQRLQRLQLGSVGDSRTGERTETVDDIERDYWRKVERYLDLGAGACHLRRPEIAALVADALRHFHGRQYLLEDWVIMPNHVHLILWPMPTHTLSEILKGRKQFTALRANRLLKREGQAFWQVESFDRWIRDDEEKARTRRYIRNNPVVARLCEQPEHWQWSSAWVGTGDRAPS